MPATRTTAIRVPVKKHTHSYIAQRLAQDTLRIATPFPPKYLTRLCKRRCGLGDDELDWKLQCQRSAYAFGLLLIFGIISP